MREQGIAANATPRAIRGENKKIPSGEAFQSAAYGRSTALHDRVIGIAKELSHSGTVVDPARKRLIETRKSLVSAWMKAAEVLDAQGEIILAGDVRYFVNHLPPVLTDRQRLAAQFIGFVQKQLGIQRDGPERRLPQGPGADAVGPIIGAIVDVRGYSHEKRIEKSNCIQPGAIQKSCRVTPMNGR